MTILNSKLKAMILVFWIPIAIGLVMGFFVAKNKNEVYLFSFLGVGAYLIVLYFWKKEFVKAFLNGMYKNENEPIIKN
ncbi:MAG: hypothetical protein Q7K42_03350 [Candidatus Diapherotrites archaeon]|nr:hypothetical protein [Candidatus Diapherotrites archaeon]